MNNITIGPHIVSYRFLSTHTGTVSNVHFYLIVDGPHAGYNSGTGGTLRIQLETDDGTDAHNPSGTVLGTYSIPQPQNPFPVISFSSAPKLKAGTLYHLVFSNTDPNPSENFVSVDDLYLQKPLNPPKPVSANEAVGESFTVSGGNRPVTNVAVRVARVTGSGDLTLRLEQSDGNLVEQGTVAASDVPLSSSTYVWATYTFSAVRTLLDGQGYHLVLQAPSGTKYQAYPIRKGSAESFHPTTFFPDGYAEFGFGGSWAGWTQWAVTDRTDSDLQFYFTVVP